MKDVANKDSFGLDAAAYRRFRPRYPRELFAYLKSLAPATGAALDCATGNGQAAVDLAFYFDRVAAFDSSAAQIDAAIPHARVEYRVGPAEHLPFDTREFDLITAAQAAHWFDLAAFYRGVARVANPGAVLAIWGYSYCRIDAAVDRIVETELLGRIEPYWGEGNRVIREHYRTIEFPFEELPWREFSAWHAWTRADYLQYLGTWSAVKKFAAEHGEDPVAALDRALADAWPDDRVMQVAFDLVGRLGRIDPDRA